MKTELAKILTPNFGRRSKSKLSARSTNPKSIISTSAMKRAQILQQEHLRVNGERLDVFELARALSI